ncbi:EAL domain-containing protein [Eubacteriaceae bacterium ES3]|nr:EAL domain-containing protein [Eubacteriaceae bacterium ES3]
MGFKLKLCIFMIIIVSSSIILMGVVNTYKSSELTRNILEQSAIDISTSESRTISGLIDMELKLPEYLTKDTNVISLLDNPDSDDLEANVVALFQDYFDERDNLDGIFIADANGIILTGLNPLTKGLDLSYRSYDQKVMTEKVSVISETLVSQKDNRMIVVVAHPVFSQSDQQIKGFIGTVIYADSLAKYLYDISLTGIETSFVYLVDENGNYIYSPDEDHIGQTVEIPEIQTLLSNETEKSSATICEYETTDGKMIAACSIIPETNWLLVVSGNMDELQEPIRKTNFFIVGVGIIIAIIAALVILYATQYLTQPVIKDLEEKNTSLERLNEELFESKSSLHKKNKLFEIIMEASNDGIWYMELSEGKPDYTNAMSHMKSKNLKTITETEWHEYVHPDDRIHTMETFDLFIKGSFDLYEGTYRLLSADNTYQWIRSKGKAFYDESGKRYILAGVHTDIDKLKKQEEQLNFLAHHDTLTQLPNRSLLMDRLSMAIEEAAQNMSHIAILFIDIDNFKHINDSMGHATGDLLLKQTADVIRKCIRATDIAARFGGDEFVVIFQNIKNIHTIHVLTEKLKNVFLLPFHIDDADIFINISIGVTVYPMDGLSAEELLTNADMAMYKAKQNGKNRIDFFNSSMKEDIIHRVELERRMPLALTNSEFVLYYQPQFRIANDEVRGFEALLRWNDPVNGKVSPNEFIPIAEDNGFIIPLGQYVLREACRTMKRWKDTFAFTGVMSVNVSYIQLRMNDFSDFIHRTVKEFELQPEDIELEITESVLIDSFDLVISKLNDFRNAGFKIALDDFGTGYSSLSYLKSLPLDTLKIDKSFIQEITVDSKSADIIESIIQLIHKLDIETIAEGVETKEQYQYLKNANCNHVQGYIKSRPIPADQIDTLIFGS